MIWGAVNSVDAADIYAQTHTSIETRDGRDLLGQLVFFSLRQLGKRTHGRDITGLIFKRSPTSTGAVGAQHFQASNQHPPAFHSSHVARATAEPPPLPVSGRLADLYIERGHFHAASLHIANEHKQQKMQQSPSL